MVMEIVLDIARASGTVGLRPQTTQIVTRGAARLLIGLGYAPVAEVSLPN